MMTRKRLLTLALLTEGGLLALAIGAARFFKNIVFISSYDHIVRDVVMGLLCSLLPLGLFISVCIRPPRFLSSFRKVILNDVRQLFARAKAIDIVLISLLAGMGEEFLFRGVLQAKIGIVWSSLIFGLFHFLTPTYFLFATVMSFYLGGLYIYFNGVTVPVSAHFAYDLAALIYLRFIYKDGGDQH
ncbi:CPBP family intramembrane glutamic endopeptidase [Candidatus Magnetominusculus dajiuhuensis]|uniref:CPBP family intramembrane glutamic endopeptidase n=1 Tax=Candidatus Magnetominusculus dajiuhuensis TaxID=3137712 RepID=UPI003B42ED07